MTDGIDSKYKYLRLENTIYTTRRLIMVFKNMYTI